MTKNIHRQNQNLWTHIENNNMTSDIIKLTSMPPIKALIISVNQKF